MKRFLTSLLVFALYGLVLYVILMIGFGMYVPDMFKKNLNYKLGGSGFLYSRLQEVKQVKDVDILFLGSSHAYRSYDTRIFKQLGLNSFNLGSSSQSPIITEVIVEKYLNQLNPKFVVFDVYPKVFGSDGVESTLDVIANANVDAGVIDLTAKVNNIKTYNTLIYSLFRQKASLDAGFKEPAKEYIDTYIPGGYVESFKEYRSRRPIEKSTYTISDKQMEAFQHIIAVLKSRKIPYVLIQSPITKKLYNSISNNAEMDKIFSGYGKYYNFNETLSLPDSLFFDDNHLNQLGVNIFDKEVIKVLPPVKTLTVNK